MKLKVLGIMSALVVSTSALATCDVDFTGKYVNTWGTTLQISQRDCDTINVTDLGNRISYQLILDGKTITKLPNKFVAHNASRNGGIIKSGIYVAEHIKGDALNEGYVGAMIMLEIPVTPKVSIVVQGKAYFQRLRNSDGTTNGITSGVEDLRVIDIGGVSGTPAMKHAMIDGANLVLSVLPTRELRDGIGMMFQSI